MQNVGECEPRALRPTIKQAALATVTALLCYYVGVLIHIESITWACRVIVDFFNGGIDIPLPAGEGKLNPADGCVSYCAPSRKKSHSGFLFTFH